MSLTQLAIEKNRITYVVLFLVAVSGVLVYLDMPRDYDPGFTVRTAVVVTIFPGASPERVERLITDKLEKVIQEMPELKDVRSESATGVSILWVDVKPTYKEMRPIWDKLRRKVEKARRDLPAEIVGPRVDDEFGDVFGVIVGLAGEEEEFEYRELKDVADDVRDELLLIDEVAKVEIYGAQEERIFVEYQNARLSELGLSPIQLQRILESQNIIIPGGDIRTERERIVLEPSGNFESFAEVKRALIQLPGRREVIALEDVATIERGYVDPPKTMMRSSGMRCLGLAVSMREGGNIIRLGEELRATIDRLKAYYPIGLELDYLQFQPDAVEKKIDEFAGNLYQAIGLVALVILIALGLRTGLVVASLIPMTIVASFLVMSLLGVGLDQMALAGLIIALGMLVDNSIVMSESIMVRMAAGDAPARAAIGSAAELKVPLLTSSLTTIAAFLPMYLAESDAGEYVAPIFKVVTITLMVSWVLSLTMIPLLCARFLRVKADPGKRSFDSRFYVRYRALLLAGLRRPWLSLAGVLAILVLALFSFRFLPFIFFPPNDRPTFTVEIEMPVGTPITRTETVVTRFEQFIEENLRAGPERPEGVSNWATFIGQGAPRFILVFDPKPQRPEYAILLLNTTSRKVVDELVPELDRFARMSFPDLKATIRPLDVGPPAWPPIQVRVSGRDSEKLFRIVDEVKARLRELPTRLIDDDWGARSKKLNVLVNQPRARRAGVTNQDVAISLRTFLSGLDATVFREDDKLIPVTLRSVAAERQDVDRLETLNVYAQTTGQSVPLKQVADVEVVWQPSKIKRYDRLKTVTVEAALEAGVTAVEVNASLKPWLDEQEAGWGPGYSWAFGGEAESSGESGASIQEKVPVAVLAVVLLLVAQFNSIRRPVIILLTIPLSIIGVIFGLLVARSYFGFMTLMGIIALAGIVINNAIMLLDRIRLEIEENGLEPARAVIEAAQRRLRPILLTTATTIGGLIPLWYGGGVMYQPMAITIIFGLAFATVLTLGVVPVLYSIFFRVRFARQT